MVALLAEKGACTAGELGSPFGIAQSTASKHLRTLEQAGLIRRQVAGRTHRFELDTSPLAEAEEWLARHRRFWSGALDRLGALLEDPPGKEEMGDV